MLLSSCVAELPRLCGEPLLRGVFKHQAADFCVDEELGFECTGAGEHLWVLVRKTGITTTEAASRLARAAGVRASAISWSGLKDKQGVCRQWFSIHCPGKKPDGLASAESDALLIEQQLYNSRKLRRGSHRRNHFTISLRSVTTQSDATDIGLALADLEQRLQRLTESGTPNYFGEQRFGFSNLADAREFFAGRRKPRHRNERGIWLSAARSAIFNDILAKRVSTQSWNRYMEGDVMNLDGSGSVFVPDHWDEVLQQRLDSGDIHPTAAIWGRGELASRGSVRELELAVAAASHDFAEGLCRAGLQQERRSLRLPVKALNYCRPGTAGTEALSSDGLTLRLSFSLPAGSYATAVLRELLAYETAPADNRPLNNSKLDNTKNTGSTW